MKKLGIDTGGTFTDLIGVASDGRVHTTKVLSNPDDPTLAIAEGLKEFAKVEQIVHGTTVATNALLERRGARCALIVNEGFEDILTLRRQARPLLYGFEQIEPEHVIARELIWGIAGRLDETGKELVPLEVSRLRQLALAFEEQGVEAVAICLLHAYANPDHELAARNELVRAGLDVPISLSHEVHNAFREYERTSTTVVNAYVKPKMAGYLNRIEELAQRVDIMQSNGGVTSPRMASKFPVNTLLSGPAGGVVGAQIAASELGIDAFLTLDIGGTSTDVSLVRGKPALRESSEIDSLAVGVPALDIHTVGAGGGSIAWIDEGGALRVGPHSAGSSPGPIVFGRGGQSITVTDAHVFLKRIVLKKLEARGISTDYDSMALKMAELGDRLGMTSEAVADGIIQIANSVMGRALKVVSVSRGVDVAGLTLIAFGGGGGLHVCDLAADLGIRRCVLPAHSEVLSAWGLYQASKVQIERQTLLHELDQALVDTLKSRFAASEATEIDLLLRYRGQGFELDVNFGASSLRTAQDVEHRFRARHLEEYGYQGDGLIECVGYRVIARSEPEPPSLSTSIVLEGPSVWIPEGWKSTQNCGHLVMERE